MIVLDTNVLSEFMRVNPDPGVVAWLNVQPTSTLYVTTITEAEILRGIALLPDGRRRRDLSAAVERALGVLFDERILPFDSAAAHSYAPIAASRRASGNPISQADCQIAAIARSKGASVATRDMKGFQDCGIEVVNPWLHMR
jgi:predicted nucleic acid-binding protein